MTKKTRYVQVGVGGRAEIFYRAIAERFAETCELVGICDRNAGRLQQRLDWLTENGMVAKGYPEAGFMQMLEECKPDIVIVSTIDREHDAYACAAMEFGCDVICEKPMTIDGPRCRRMIDTQRKTGRHCAVTFNLRYAPSHAQLKEVLMSGVIGDVLSVDFQWMLNQEHGADYFRRWHRNKENSGGLLVHKSTHHFDFINWCISAIPETVYAVGARNFYTPQQAKRFGLTNPGERCLTCPEKAICPMVMDISAVESLRTIYLENEGHDGYMRDRCVFSPEIDIEDTMHLTVTYDTGAMMSYSLHAFMPWEGYYVVFNGTKGRIEHRFEESVFAGGDALAPGTINKEGTWLKVLPYDGEAYEIPVAEGEGSHGGGDKLMLEDLFLTRETPDPLMRAADQRAGAYSLLTGAAANVSIATGQAVKIASLVPNIGYPDYPDVIGAQPCRR